MAIGWSVSFCNRSVIKNFDDFLILAEDDSELRTEKATSFSLRDDLSEKKK